MMDRCVHVLVSGRVQGVYFRAFTKKSADELGVKGWVRNLGDGRVEAFACGDNGALSKFLEALKKGPPVSRVDALDVTDAESSEECDGFSILR